VLLTQLDPDVATLDDVVVFHTSTEFQLNSNAFRMDKKCLHRIDNPLYPGHLVFRPTCNYIDRYYIDRELELAVVSKN